MFDSLKYWKKTKSAIHLVPKDVAGLKLILTVSNKHLRVLCRREMAHALHRLVLAASDLVASRLAHGRGIGPVVLAREHVHRALLGIDAGHAAAAVPST